MNLRLVAFCILFVLAALVGAAGVLAQTPEAYPPEVTVLIRQSADPSKPELYSFTLIGTPYAAIPLADLLTAGHKAARLDTLQAQVDSARGEIRSAQDDLAASRDSTQAERMSRRLAEASRDREREAADRALQAQEAETQALRRRLWRERGVAAVTIGGLVYLLLTR